MGKGRRTTAWLLGALAALGGALAIALSPWIDLEQEFGLPWLFRVRGPVAPPQDVVVVAIDEDSPAELGVPDKPRDWPRTLHAELVRYLAQAGARVIVFDMTFDTTSAQPADDAEFAAAARAAGNVLVTQSLRKDVQHLAGAAGDSDATMVIEKPAPPVPVIAEAVAGSAPFLLPKASRVDATWTSWGGATRQPTLPVVAWQRFTASQAQAPGTGPAAADQRRSANVARLLSGSDSLFLNLYGPPRTVTTVPYHRVLALARGAPEADGAVARLFRGQAVFVGQSARTPAGQDRARDDYGTVYSEANGMNLSGVELAATAFANLLHDRAVTPLDVPWRYAIALAWALVLAVLCHALAPLRAMAVTAALAALYLGLVHARFAATALWLPAVIPLALQAPLAMVTHLWLHYRSVQREREAIKRAFGHFLPASIVDQLALDVGSMTESNRVLRGSCLATDVTDYTTLAEGLPPGELGRLMNAYFAQLFVPVERSGGAVMDVVGDAMVAVWVAGPSDLALRRKACEATLEVAANVERFNRTQAAGMALPTRLALHAGDMLVGNIGASQHYEYRAVGDTVNTASRLQGLNKALGTTMLASTAAIEGVNGLRVRPLGSFRFVGKSSALEVVELQGHSADAAPAQVLLSERFADALRSYAQGDWQQAADGFAAILVDTIEDGPSRFYLAHCERLLAQPPTLPWSPTIALENK